MITGVGSATAGIDLWGALGMSMIVYSGAAQIIATQLLVAQAPLVVVIPTCFITGLRFSMYSAALAPYLKPLAQRWRNTLPFVLSDQGFAIAIRRFDELRREPRRAALYFLGGGSGLWLGWQTGNMCGYFAGNLIPANWSLDFAVPLCFVALIAPALVSFPVILAALVAGALVLMLAGLPMKLNLIIAGLAGIATGTLADMVEERWSIR
jgi:predicted branched-subunit amino acid permease